MKNVNEIFYNICKKGTIHKCIWNGSDKNGKEIQPGTYFLLLTENGKKVETVKLFKK